jgi:hypothetical protein
VLHGKQTALENSAAIPLPGARDAHGIPLPAVFISYIHAVDI